MTCSSTFHLLFMLAGSALIGCGADSKDDVAATTETPSDAGAEASAAASSSDASTDGLGGTCPATGCNPGQECVTAPGPGGDTSTCEIKCTTNAECPFGLRCNLPPILPDSLVNTCIQ